MSEVKFTPGPWRVQEEALYEGHHVGGRMPEVLAGEKTRVARVTRHCIHGKCLTAEANARLISAAPDLLEELSFLVSGDCTPNDVGMVTICVSAKVIETARAAIAKAATP